MYGVERRGQLCMIEEEVIYVDSETLFVLLFFFFFKQKTAYEI